MKVCILSGRYPATSFNSAINHRIYADRHNYVYIHCNWPNKIKNPYLNKVYYILEYIDFFDYIFWIDDDAFFWDLEKDILDYANEGEICFSFCSSPTYKELKTYLSSGQFLIKSNDISKSFLNDVLKTNIEEVKNWWSSDLGFFSNGDQDIMIYLFHTSDKYKNTYKLYDYKFFNSRVENLYNIDKHHPFILHFTGKKDIKTQNYIKVAKDFDLHTSLVAKEILEQYPLVAEPNRRKKNKFIRRLKKWFLD